MQQTRHRNDSIVEEYRSLCRKTKKATKRSIIDFEYALVDGKCCKKRLYSYAKSKQKYSNKISAMRDPSGKITNSGLEICNILNDYFKSNHAAQRDSVTRESGSHSLISATVNNH